MTGTGVVPNGQITEAMLTEWEDACAQATDGPWCFTVEGEKVADYSLGVGYSSKGDDFETNLAGYQAPDDVEFDERICYRESAEGTNASSDFAFIAIARTAMPLLIAALRARAGVEVGNEVDSLRKELQHTRETVDILDDTASAIFGMCQDAGVVTESMTSPDEAVSSLVTAFQQARAATDVTDTMVARAVKKYADEYDRRVASTERFDPREVMRATLVAALTPRARVGGAALMGAEQSDTPNVPTDTETAQAAFVEWFEANYPPRCVITNPSWHAPKIFRAVLSAMRTT
jgi:hypothetical protein